MSDPDDLSSTIFIGPVTQRELILTWMKRRKLRAERELAANESRAKEEQCDEICGGKSPQIDAVASITDTNEMPIEESECPSPVEQEKDEFRVTLDGSANVVANFEACTSPDERSLQDNAMKVTRTSSGHDLEMEESAVTASNDVGEYSSSGQRENDPDVVVVESESVSRETTACDSYTSEIEASVNKQKATCESPFRSVEFPAEDGNVSTDVRSPPEDSTSNEPAPVEPSESDCLIINTGELNLIEVPNELHFLSNGEDNLLEESFASANCSLSQLNIKSSGNNSQNELVYSLARSVPEMSDVHSFNESYGEELAGSAASATSIFNAAEGASCIIGELQFPKSDEFLFPSPASSVCESSSNDIPAISSGNHTPRTSPRQSAVSNLENEPPVSDACSSTSKLERALSDDELSSSTAINSTVPTTKLVLKPSKLNVPSSFDGGWCYKFTTKIPNKPKIPPYVQPLKKL